MPTYQFPKDHQNDYLGKVIFRRVKYVPPAGEVPPVGSFFNNQTDNVSESSNDAAAEAGGLRGFGSTSNIIDYINNSSVVTPAKVDVVDYTTGVSLYLPQSFQVADGASYDDTNLGVLGAGVEAGMRAGSGALGAVYNAAKQAGTSAIDLLQNGVTTGPTARVGAVRLAQQTAPDTVIGGIKSALAVSVNPNTRSLFNSVRLREFTFTWTMIANSASEAQEIEYIVKWFRETLYPTTISEGSISFGYNFPDKIEVTTLYNGITVGTKIRPSYLKSIQTVYNPSSMGYHLDGKPSEVSLTINFGEDRALSQADIRNGY